MATHNQPVEVRPEGYDTMSPEMPGAKHYYGWIADQIRPYLKDNLLDIGGGYGAHLEPIILDCQRILSIELSADSVALMQEKFTAYPHFQARQMDFGSNSSDYATLVAAQFEMITCLDVLEHIEDDLAALKDMHSILVAQKGTLFLKVPAHQWLYGSLDSLAGHFRRYDKARLNRILGEAGFKVQALYYFNAFGVLPWFINARVLKPKTLEAKSIGLQVRLFDRYFVPVLSRLEAIVSPPIGQALIAIAQA